jgi:hypothetical protein
MSVRGYTYDNLLNLKTAGAITSSAAVATILDTNNGAVGNPSRFDAVAVVDVSAIDVSSANETYDIIVQLSNSATFASGVVNRIALKLGTTVAGSSANDVVGRYELPFDNEFAEQTYRYVRLYTLVGGTTPSINYKAFAAMHTN